MGGGQKVLVAVDESEQAEKALRWYLEHLHQPGDTVLLEHVVEDAIDPKFVFRSGLAIRKEQWEEMQQEQNKKIEALKEKLAAILRGYQVSSKFIREFGDPGKHLAERVSQEDVDLVVMATRGQGTVRRTILGSVSDYLIHHVNTQVCIYRG